METTTLPTVHFQDLGTIPYQTAWDYQTELFNESLARKTRNRDLPAEEHTLPENHLLFVEHPHVYTLGKSGSMDNLLLTAEEMAGRSIEFFKINRGGDITYHGPGQVVGYPILDMDQFFTDIHKYMRYLEEVIIRTLAEYGIAAGRYPGYTGVWLDADDDSRARKICAMGVKCSRWVTMHGWAFNVNADLDYFGHIIPCGIKDKDVTSMQKELGHPVDMEEVKAHLRRHFADVFGCRLVQAHIPGQA